MAVRHEITNYMTGSGSTEVGFMWRRDSSGGDSIIARPTNVYPVKHKGQHVWVRKPKRGRLSENPYSLVMSYVTDNLPTVYYSTGTIRKDINCRTYCTFGLGSAWTNNDQIALLGKLREKVAGSSFNAAVSMAEGKEALETIFGAAKRLADFFMYLKKKNYREATRSLTGHAHDPSKTKGHTAAGNYLEYQYGWKPLLNDVYDAAVFLAHLSSVPLQKVITVHRNVPSTVARTTTNFDCHTKFAMEGRQIKCLLREVNVVQLSGLLDPASVAWEKLPYSFVADWFIPVGNFLQARGLAQALTGTFVTSHFSSWFATGLFVDPHSTGFLRVEDANLRQGGTILDRTVSTSLSVPLPQVVPLSKWATWDHATKAVALFVNANKLTRESSLGA